MLQYNILGTVKRYKSFETIGGLFHQATDSVVQLSVTDRIWGTLQELVRINAEAFQIDDEMIRVAKPKGRIAIANESEKGNRIFNLITGTKIEFVLPVALVPENMDDLIVRTIWKGYGYAIAFTRPS